MLTNHTINLSQGCRANDMHKGCVGDFFVVDPFDLTICDQILQGVGGWTCRNDGGRLRQFAQSVVSEGAIHCQQISAARVW